MEPGSLIESAYPAPGVLADRAVHRRTASVLLNLAPTARALVDCGSHRPSEFVQLACSLILTFCAFVVGILAKDTRVRLALLAHHKVLVLLRCLLSAQHRVAVGF